MNFNELMQTWGKIQSNTDKKQLLEVSSKVCVAYRKVAQERIGHLESGKPIPDSAISADDDELGWDVEQLQQQVVLMHEKEKGIALQIASLTQESNKLRAALKLSGFRVTNISQSKKGMQLTGVTDTGIPFTRHLRNTNGAWVGRGVGMDATIQFEMEHGTS